MRHHLCPSVLLFVALYICGSSVAAAVNSTRSPSKSSHVNQLLSPPPEIEEDFKCPDQMPISLRAGAGRSFVTKLSALNPGITVEQASSIRRTMLEQHGCDSAILRLFNPTSLSRDQKPVASSLGDMAMATEFYADLHRGAVSEADRLLISRGARLDLYLAAAIPAPRTNGGLSFTVDYIELGGEGAVHIAYHINNSRDLKCHASATVIFGDQDDRHGIRTVFTDHGCDTWTRVSN